MGRSINIHLHMATLQEALDWENIRYVETFSGGQFGIKLEIIDSREEGLLTLRGVLAGIDDPKGDLLVFDVGGGSTEYTLTQGKEPLFTESLPLGVVRLTEGKKSPEAMEDKISRELTTLRSKLVHDDLLKFFNRVSLVGTAGGPRRVEQNGRGDTGGE